MDLLLENARIIDPDIGKERRGWVAIQNGLIEHAGSGRAEADARARIDCAGQCLAPGIVDIGVKIGEPGERHMESFRTAGRAAAAGGVTTMITRPDTSPPIDNPETLEFFVRRAKASTPVRIRPMATLTKGRAGAEMTEIGLLQDAGAIAFSDCDSVVEDTRVMSRCLTYCAQRGAIVVAHPQDPRLSRGASATAGRFAFLLGLSTVSPMAERMGLERDLALVEMTNSRYHADQVTTRQGLTVVERAKSRGLDFSAGISIHHLTLNELDIADYRTFFKVKPPLRSEEDREAMVEAVANGLLEVISSMHTPQDEESKRLPFEQAASGAVAVETLLPAALRLYHSGQMNLPKLFRAISRNPARRLGLESGRLARGAPADLVLFNPDTPFVLDRFKLHSKSQNTPFDGQLLQGKVLRTFVGGAQVYPET